MKYYSIRHKNIYYQKYAINSSKYYMLICFDDNDLQDLYEIFKKEELENNKLADNQELQKQIVFDYVSEDNTYYQMNLADGKIKKGIKYPLKKVFKQFKKCDDKIINIKSQKEEIKNNYNKSTLQKQKSSAILYKKYLYIDREYCIKIPFRLRKSTKDKKQPLVIYLHGAGCVGNDNSKQLFEYLFLNTGLRRKECHLLIPQCDVFAEDNLAVLDIYTKSIKKLVVEVGKEINIDFDRIYIIGSSFGGACVWYSVYNNPGFYAGAIPLMGYFADVYSADFKIDNMTQTAIWAGHAENDKCVSIDDDNALYDKLKQAGCDIKFSRYPKYGHRMNGVFIRKEKWKQWLFSKSLIK